MIALSDMLTGWALDKSTDPNRSAFLTGVSEGLLAEADLLGPDWNPPEPEELTVIGVVGRLANGDRIRPKQRHEEDGNSGDAVEGRSDWWK